jgi:hypothetical protein
MASHTPKLESHNVLNVGKGTIPRCEKNRGEPRDALPQNLLVTAIVLKHIKMNTITIKTKTTKRKRIEGCLP